MKRVIANVVLAAGAVAFAVVCGTALYETWEHPCVATEKRPAVCGGETYCSNANYDPYFCMIWETSPTYPCTETVCVRRRE